MRKILFVCHGNICRSPMAEAIFNYKIKKKGLLDSYHCDSCGTANHHQGLPPDHRTIKNASQNGIPISHAARQLTDHDLHYFDLILAMDKSNYDYILRLSAATINQDKIKLMREFDPHERGEVPDPYYGGDDDFQEVFHILDRSIENMISTISKVRN